MINAAYEVRITPLIRGVPGTLVETGAEHGLTAIELEDTVELTQFSGLRVALFLNVGRTASVTISMFDPTPAAGSVVEGSLVAGLRSLHQALWIGYLRPGEVLAETIFFGQCKVRKRFAAATLELVGADPYAGKCRKHYVRRGDTALNIDSQRGKLHAHFGDIDTMIECARNIVSQQDRAMPALGMRVDQEGFFSDPDYEDSPFIEFERGQEVTSLVDRVVDQADGPDIDVRPEWFWPTRTDVGYCVMSCYDHPTDPEAPGIGELGRNLTPLILDNPAADRVVFEYGYVGDSLEDLETDPGDPTTHAHVLDADKRFRVTRADISSSNDIGAWVEFIEVDFKVPRDVDSEGHEFEPDLRALEAIASAHVRAYGVPPEFLTCVHRPEAVQARHFGHPGWAAAVPEGIPRTGGQWYIGDYIPVRAKRGFCEMLQLTRVVGATFVMDKETDLPRIIVDLIPAIGGVPGLNADDEEGIIGGDGAPPVVGFSVPDPIDDTAVVSETVLIAATAFDGDGIFSVDFTVEGVSIPGAFEGSPAGTYAVNWDTTGLADGFHTVTFEATDNTGISSSTTIEVEISNAEPTVEVTSPADEAIVTGTIELAATAGGDVISNVDFDIDGVPTAGFSDYTAPYTKMWDSTTVTDGAHVLTARVQDRDGQVATSAPIAITVDNGA